MGNHICEFSTGIKTIKLCGFLLDNRYLKNVRDMKKLVDDDSDIYYKSDVDHYECRNEVEYYQRYKKVAKCDDNTIIDKNGFFWNPSKTPAIIRLYPYYTEYMADQYYAQRILKLTPFRSVKQLLENIDDFRDYVIDKILGQYVELIKFEDRH